jgi:hypothetical protein
MYFIQIKLKYKIHKNPHSIQFLHNNVGWQRQTKTTITQSGQGTSEEKFFGIKHF